VRRAPSAEIPNSPYHSDQETYEDLARPRGIAAQKVVGFSDDASKSDKFLRGPFPAHDNPAPIFPSSARTAHPPFGGRWAARSGSGAFRGVLRRNPGGR
jgi:hypothetical protein